MNGFVIFTDATSTQPMHVMQISHCDVNLNLTDHSQGQTSAAKPV